MGQAAKKSLDRRREIIKAAREHFQTEDFKKITMQNLMEKLNIAKGTIYHHFASKWEILEAVVEEMVDEELLRKKELLRKNKNQPALQKLIMLITESNAAEKNGKLLENLHHPDNAQIHARQIARILVKTAPLYASVIEEGCEEGIFNTKHPLECAEFLIAGIQFLTDMGFYAWNEGELERRVESFPFIIETLLGAPRGMFDFFKANY